MSKAQRTLLQIINQAQTELGLPLDASIQNSPSTTGMQMLGMLQAISEEMRDIPEEGWTSFQTEFNLVVSPPVITTGNVGAASPVVTGIAAGTGTLSAGNWAVSGNNLLQGARIKSVDSSSQVTLTMEATGALTGAALVFAQDTYILPPDFHHYIGDTWWDRTNRWKLIGPDSPQRDQFQRSGVVATGPRRHWRQLGRATNNQWRIWPPPAEIVNPLQLVFEYVSTDFVNVSGLGTSTAAVWANDADLPFLDDRALINGVKWKFWEQKGFNWISKMNDWLDLVDRLIARDGGNKKLQLARRFDSWYLNPVNSVQDGFFPGPTGSNSS